MKIHKQAVAIIDPVGTKAGMDKYDLSLAQALQDAGCRVDVLSDFNNGSSQKSFFAFRKKRTLLSIISFYFECATVIRWCKQHEIGSAVVHVFSFSFFEALLLRRLKKSGINTVSIVHDAEPFFKKVNVSRRLRMLTTYSKHVVVHNRFTADALERLTGNRISVNVMPHGHFIDAGSVVPPREAARSKLGISQDAFCPLFFGMIKPTKGLDTLMDALKFLPGDTQLLVAGRPRGPVKDVIRRLKAIPNVKMRIGYIEPDESAYWFAAADLVVLPYTKSYQSGVAIQAMSRKLPVVMSDLEPHLEWVAGGAGAALFRTGDARDLADQILKCRDNPFETAARVEQAFAFLNTAHDWRKAASIILNLLRQS